MEAESKKYILTELIDMEKSQRLLDNFCGAVEIAGAIIDLEGEILLESVEGRICKDFHRVHPVTCEKCTKIGNRITNELIEGKRLSIYCCPNGLNDAFSPIIIEGQHIAYAFLGQFLMAPPDVGFFRLQAAKYGFNEKAYLEALNEVPVIKEKKLSSILGSITICAEFLASLGLSGLRHLEAERALRSSQRRFKETIELLPTIVCEYDKKGMFTYLNMHGLDALGFSSADLKKGLYVKQLFPDPEKEKFNKRLLSLLKGAKQEPIEYRLKKKDGSILEVIITSAPVYEKDRIVGGRSCITEITEFNRTQEALRESEKRYKELSDFLPQVVFETDREGCLTFANLNAFKAFGYTESDFKKRLYVLEMLVPEDRERAGSNIEKILSGKNMGGIEYTAQRKDGSRFPVLIHSNCIMRKEMPAGLRGIIIDLSESKLAEKERLKLEARLQRAEKMEAIGTLAGGVAHDLNNVLSGIVSYPDLLLMQLPEKSPLRNPLMTIKGAGEKAADIVQDLLTLARRGITYSEAVDLNEIVLNYMKSFEYDRLLSYHPDVEVKVDLCADLLYFLGSTVHLSKTVMNLVANAAEAMPDGGMIFISTENRYIERPIAGFDEPKQGDYVVLNVSDTGIGISRDDMKRIFEPFFSKKKMGRSGTGLGMSVVWGTVKDHNGYIDLQSVEEKGSTFILYFPVTRKGLEKNRSEFSIEKVSGNMETILVVDDVQEQREVAFNILSSLGYSVFTSSSGEKAVEYLKRSRVDLVVLDMIMEPGMDGLETYRKVLELYPGQKAIITSGFSETERVKEAQELGAGDYVKKPYTIEKIGAAVNKELKK